MRRAVAGFAVAGVAVLTLTGCKSVDASAHCDEVDGRWVCTSVVTPDTPATTTPPAPTSEPPVSEPPVTTEPPAPTNPNDGKVAASLAATPLQGKARADWTTTRTDVTGWRIERDGMDTSGFGVWGTELPADARTLTFDLLRPGDTYRFTLVAHTAGGDLPAVNASVVVLGAPPVVVPPVTGSASAADRFGWGTPLTQSDEFNYTGAPTASKWGLYDGPGHAGNGRRVAGLSTVQDGFLRQTGKTNGDSAGMASKLDQKYGKVESRVRFAGSGAGNKYHPVLLQWTDAYPFPSGGELDWLENNVGDTRSEAFIHHPTQSGTVQDHYVGSSAVDFTQWHNIAMTWSPTEIAGYVDGVKWFSDVKPAAQPPGPMHGTIQLDNFFGSGMQAATFDVDWYRIYR